MPREHLVYHWRHGWIPLTHAAALAKAHGSARGAERYVPAGRSVIATSNLRKVSDEHLTALLGQSLHDSEVHHVVAEFDRRDAAARRVAAARERRNASRAEKTAAKDAEFDRRINAGDDPESAYADVYGVNVERQRRNEAIASMRSNGYKGAGFDALSRDAFRQYVNESYVNAENATRGALFRGKTKTNRSNAEVQRLFNGSETYARANASEELLAYWQQHGRLTLDDFRSSMLGAQLKSKGTAAWY